MPDSMQADPNAVISRALMTQLSLNFRDLRLDQLVGMPDAGAACEEYWTPERIAQAGPFPLKYFRGTPPAGNDLSRSTVRTSRNNSLSQIGAKTRLFKDVVTPPFDTERVPNRAVFPYSAIGKLLATVGGADFSGTAWVVGDQAIITAGHCVFDDIGQQWATNVAFMPQFDDQPVKGIWKASSIHTLAGWIGGGRDSPAYDLGAVILQQTIALTTKAIGWRANMAADQGLLHAVGYPGDWVSSTYDFDGRHMWSCNGNFVSGSSVIGMNNNMTRGCSGGPWLVQNRQGQIFACGVNSHYADDHENVMYSPYFGQGIINLIAAVS